MSYRIGWLLAGLLVGGCGNFDPSSYVNGLRVLALKGDPPDVPAGGASTVRALIAGSTDELEWALCTRAGVASQGETLSPDCVKQDTAPYLIPLGSGPSVNVSMPNVGPLDLGLPDSSGGLYVPIRLKARAGGETLTAIYPLRLTLPGLPANHNPTLDAIARVTGDVKERLVEGTPLSVRVSDTLTLRASVLPDDHEHYPLVDPATLVAVDTVESIRFFWFTTAGELAHEVTGNQADPDQTLTFKKHVPAPGTTVDLYVVARDERGGTDYAHRTLLISP